MWQPAHQDVVEDTQPLHEIELLINHSHAGAVRPQRLALKRAQVLTAKVDSALSEADGMGEAAEQGRFPGSRLANHGDELTGIDDGGDTVQSPLLAEELGDTVEDHGGRGGHRHAREPSGGRLIELLGLPCTLCNEPGITASVRSIFTLSNHGRSGGGGPSVWPLRGCCGTAPVARRDRESRAC
jgi:hypothetical protein